MAEVWTVKDGEGRVLPSLRGPSRLELGRKLLSSRHDAFHLHVSSSYREVFEH